MILEYTDTITVIASSSGEIVVPGNVRVTEILVEQPVPFYWIKDSTTGKDFNSELTYDKSISASVLYHTISKVGNITIQNRDAVASLTMTLWGEYIV